MMTKISKTYNRFDVVVVPYPFSDSPKTKRRPALVLSSAKRFNNVIEHTVMAMITSAQHSQWPLDVELVNLKKVGLTKPSLIRMKIFTLDNRLIIEKIGTLGEADKKSFLKSFEHLFNK